MLLVWECSSPLLSPGLWEDLVSSGHGWAQAGPPQALALCWFPASGLGQPQLSQLLTSLLLAFTPSFCFWSHPGCQAQPASSPSHLPRCPHVGQSSPGLAVTFPVGALNEVRGAMMAAALRGPGLSSSNSHIPGEETLFWRRLPGSGIELVYHGARAPGTHTPLLRRGCGFALSHGLASQDQPLVLPHGWLWVNSTKCVSPDPKGQGHGFVDRYNNSRNNRRVCASVQRTCSGRASPGTRPIQHPAVTWCFTSVRSQAASFHFLLHLP